MKPKETATVGTRVAPRHQEQERLEKECEAKEYGVLPNSNEGSELPNVPEREEEDWMKFIDEDMLGQQAKEKTMMCSQKQRQRAKYIVYTRSWKGCSSRSNIREVQAVVEPLCKEVEKEESCRNSGYFQRNGLLYCKWIPP